MCAPDSTRCRQGFRRVVLTLTIALVIAGCATGPESRKSARIEIQEEIGFTITEEARISGGVRMDYENALDLLERGQQEQGIELLQRVAEQAPELSAPRIDLGIAYHRAGDLESAEHYLERAEELDPESPEVWFHCAALRYGQKRTEEAKIYLMRSIEKSFTCRVYSGGYSREFPQQNASATSD